MREALKRIFGIYKPRAVVLDDEPNARRMTSRRLKQRGFEVLDFSSLAAFKDFWKPGLVDVIISDWELSHKATERGDRVLQEIRNRDWDVPFVLISGKLAEATDRIPVLEHLLGSGGARFVERGNSGIAKACEVAEDLIERRDQTVMKVVLALRAEALANVSIATSTGRVSALDALEALVAKPSRSHEAARPLTNAKVKKMVRSK